MKRREISLILAGFLLFMIPIQIQSTMTLPKFLPAGQVNINRNITENIYNVTERELAQTDAGMIPILQTRQWRIISGHTRRLRMPIGVIPIWELPM